MDRGCLWLQTHPERSPGFSRTRQALDGGAFHTPSKWTYELEQVHHFYVPGARGSGVTGTAGFSGGGLCQPKTACLLFIYFFETPLRTKKEVIMLWKSKLSFTNEFIHYMKVHEVPTHQTDPISRKLQKCLSSEQRGK